MPPGSDQPQQKRRSGGMYSDGTGQNPHLYPSTSEKIIHSATTGGLDDEEDFPEPPRQHSSVIRLDTPQGTPSQRLSGSYAHSVPTRRQTRTKDLPPVRQPRQPRTTQTRITVQQPFGAAPPASSRGNKNVHWLLPLGVGMVAMLVLWITGSWVLAWGSQRFDDIRYGIPRTYQTNAVVGHGGDSLAHPSHFIAINLNRQVVVIELMAGDPAKSVSYVVPYYIVGEDADLTPVTVEFRDVNADHKPDMIVHIHLPSQDNTVVFINDGTKFRPSNGTDNIHL